MESPQIRNIIIEMSDRIRLVVMGDSRVGKSSIVKRFLFGEFNVKHIPTIEGKIEHIMFNLLELERF